KAAPSNVKSIKDTCKSLHLAPNVYTLTASCQSNGGSSKESSIELNNFIGNNNGRFQWAGVDFDSSSSNIRLLD
ncbi:hypothetical protein BGW38_000670, partial [Lunasporangiospora selenospora]